MCRSRAFTVSCVVSVWASLQGQFLEACAEVARSIPSRVLWTFDSCCVYHECDFVALDALYLGVSCVLKIRPMMLRDVCVVCHGDCMIVHIISTLKRPV